MAHLSTQDLLNYHDDVVRVISMWSFSGVHQTEVFIQGRVSLLTLSGLVTMSESTVSPILTSAIIENVSHLEYNGTAGFVDYDASVIGFIIMMASFTIIGVPSNLLLVVVFRQRQKRHNGTNNLFALSLAVADAIICGVTIPLRTFSLLGMIRTDFGCGMTLFIGYMTVSFQVILMLGVCIERYCAVCRPFQRRRIKYVVVFISTAAVYSGSISAAAFPIAVFDVKIFHFCERRANLARIVMDALNATSWFVIVATMIVLYTITIVNIRKRTRRKPKVQNTSAVRDLGAYTDKSNSISTNDKIR